MANNRRKNRRRQQRRFALWVMQVRVDVERLWNSVQRVRDEVAASLELQECFKDWTQLRKLSGGLEIADSAAVNITLNTSPDLSHPLPRKAGA